MTYRAVQRVQIPSGPVACRLSLTVHLAHLPRNAGSAWRFAGDSITACSPARALVRCTNPCRMAAIVADARPRGRHTVRTVRYRWVIGIVAVCALGASLVAAETSGSAHGGLSHYTTAEVSFSYPAAWFRAHNDANTSSSHGIVTLSSQRIPVDCRPYTVTGKTTATGPQYCVTRAPTTLKKNGVYVSWVAFGSPGATLRSMPGRSAKVSGDSAKIEMAPPNTRTPIRTTCGGMGGQEQIRVTVAKRPSNFLLVDACVRGPNLKKETGEVIAMVRSTRLPRR